MTSIVLFNVKYSPNLGDGLLTECLEHALQAQRPDVIVRSIDLAMRDAYGQGGRHRRMAMAILARLPAAVRRRMATVALNTLSRRLRLRVREAMTGAHGGRTDGVVVGGGNLFADADLNFPIKLHAAMTEAAKAGVPVAIFGVGVSDNWSRRGRLLLREAVSAVRLTHAAVRDELSRTIWARELEAQGIAPALLCRDPGLLVADRYPMNYPPARNPTRPLIGLCLTDPLALRYHGGQADRRLDSWLADLVALLAGRGWTVQLFTNGSPEDRNYLERMTPSLTAAGKGQVDIEPAFTQPADLARFTASCSLVIAHRMHACIAAYGYRVPAIGLTWDPKLDSFFGSVKRTQYMVDPTRMSPSEAMSAAARTLQDGIDPDDHALVIAEARADVARLFAQLVEATA